MHRTEQPPAIPHTDPPQQVNTIPKGSNHSEVQTHTSQVLWQMPTAQDQAVPSHRLHGWLWWAGLAWIPGHSPTQLERENTTEGSKVEMRTGRDHLPVASTGKTDLI